MLRTGEYDKLTLKRAQIKKSPFRGAGTGTVEPIELLWENYSAIFLSFAYFSSAYCSAFWNRTSARSGKERVRLL